MLQMKRNQRVFAGFPIMFKLGKLVSSSVLKKEN